MKTINLAVVFLILVLTAGAFAQSAPAPERVDSLASAIAHAEGFGVKGAVPTRYHNPGDIRTSRASAHYPGQIGVNKHGYVIFKNDAAGFAALKTNLRLIAVGESKHYDADMSISKLAKVYATGWRLWAKNVSQNIGVTPNTTLRAYLFPVEETPVVASDDEPVMLDFSIGTDFLSQN
jgi:hypothetical protein